MTEMNFNLKKIDVHIEKQPLHCELGYIRHFQFRNWGHSTLATDLRSVLIWETDHVFK